MWGRIRGTHVLKYSLQSSANSAVYRVQHVAKSSYSILLVIGVRRRYALEVTGECPYEMLALQCINGSLNTSVGRGQTTRLPFLVVWGAK